MTEEGSEDDGADTGQRGQDSGVGAGGVAVGGRLVVLEPSFKVLI
jgi:hypothetical protein